MGEMTDKAKAAGNKTAGAVKDAVGKMTDNPDLQAEGKAQKAKGAAQEAIMELATLREGTAT